MPCCCQQPDNKPVEPKQTAAPACCGRSNSRPDLLLWGSLAALAAALALQLLFPSFTAAHARLHHFTGGITSLLGQMWWGLAAGILALGFLSRVPKEVVSGILGNHRGLPGLLRATAAGLALDLCNHGILLVGMGLYKRGASLAQVFAFLIASPWNSFSLTLVLFALIGWKWTLVIVLLSALVALLAGLVVESLEKHGHIPPNPHRVDLPDGYRLGPALTDAFRPLRHHPEAWAATLLTGLKESRMILRWIFFGIVLTGLVRAFLDPETFAHWFGPTLAGLGLTLLATTVIEVCSEGSSPIAADLLTRAHAPGNAFTFLMAGAATDYTEIMALRETTGSWKLSLLLPLTTVPQVLLLGWLLNQAS